MPGYVVGMDIQAEITVRKGLLVDSRTNMRRSPHARCAGPEQSTRRWHGRAAVVLCCMPVTFGPQPVRRWKWWGQSWAFGGWSCSTGLKEVLQAAQGVRFCLICCSGVEVEVSMLYTIFRARSTSCQLLKVYQSQAPLRISILVHRRKYLSGAPMFWGIVQGISQKRQNTEGGWWAANTNVQNVKG